MDGQQVVPPPGDPDGTGTTVVELTDANTICYTIKAMRIAGPGFQGHLHRAPAGEFNSAVTALLFSRLVVEDPANPFADQHFKIDDCVDVEPGVVDELRTNPEQYYVAIHNFMFFFPNYAIRGQLGF